MRLLLALLPLAFAAKGGGELVGLIKANNDAEISLGRTAQKKARREDVRRFAQLMVEQHSASNDELKRTRAEQEATDNVRLARQKAKADARRLEGLDAARFDAAYVSQQVEAHRALLTALDRALADPVQLGENAALIQRVRGVVSEHLQHAQRLQQQVAPR